MVQETVPKDVEAFSSASDPDLVGAIQVVGAIVEIDDCDATTAWSVQQGAGVTIALETNDVKEGSGSVKVTVPAGIDGIVKATVSAKDLSALNSIRVWLKDLSVTGSFYLYFGESAYNEQSTSSFQLLTSEWKEKEWVISAIAATSRDAVTIFAVRLNNTGGAQTQPFLIDYIRGVKPSKLRVYLPEGVITAWPFPSVQFPFRIRNAKIWYEETLASGIKTVTVPTGKVWSILHALAPGFNLFQINSNTWELAENASGYERNVSFGRLVKAGDSIQLDEVGATVRVWILELDADPDITIITDQGIDTTVTYTIPSGKILHITAIIAASGSPYLVVDNKNIVYLPDIALNYDEGRVYMVFMAGSVLKASVGGIRFCGYLTEATRGQ